MNQKAPLELSGGVVVTCPRSGVTKELLANKQTVTED